MAGPPSKTIGMPTGTTDAMKKELRDLQKASRECVREMAKDAKKGNELSKELIDKKKKIDDAIAAQKKQLREVEIGIGRKAAQERADEARAGRSGAFAKATQGVMMIRHLEKEVKRLDNAFHKFRGGGPDIDKEEGVVDLLRLGEHIPGPVGMAMRAARMALQAVIAIQTAIKTEARGIKEAEIALKGGRPFLDPDEVKRRDSKPVEKALTYMDPQYDLTAGFAPKALGGGSNPAWLRETLARQIRNEQAGILRTMLQGLPIIGHHAQNGGAIWGIDDENKVNELINQALTSKIPALIARAREKAAIGDFNAAERDLREIRRIDPNIAPAPNAQELFNHALNERIWAERRSLDSMGLRPIDGRAE